MAFVPGCEHDVFVSYAHIDNEPLSGAAQGWVTTFVRDVELVVRRKLFDRPKDFDLWMDHELAGNRPFGADIQQAVDQTATLLVIMSPPYLASDWCRREREAFRAALQNKARAGTRIFVVELDRIDDRQRVPPEFADLLPYRLWIEDGPARTPRTLGLPVPTPAEPEYYSRVNQLALEIAQELQRLAEAGAGAAVAPAGPTVFLAETTDDLEPRREEVRRYLVQMGLRVLPGSYYPRDDAKAYEAAMAADLAQSRLFVQLLSEAAGRKSDAVPNGFPALQYGVARRSGLPMLQWRARELDAGGVQDEAQRVLLQGETVRACGIEEFKEAVVQDATRAPRPAKPKPTDVLLFLDTDATDRALAERIGKFLVSKGIGYAIALQSGSPEEIRTDLEDNLKECDGMMLVYGAASPNWVRSKLRWCRKIVSQRSEPPLALAVCEGSPHEQAGIGIEIPGWQWIDCRAGNLDNCLDGVVQGVRG